MQERVRYYAMVNTGTMKVDHWTLLQFGHNLGTPMERVNEITLKKHSPGAGYMEDEEYKQCLLEWNNNTESWEVGVNEIFPTNDVSVILTVMCIITNKGVLEGEDT